MKVKEMIKQLEKYEEDQELVVELNTYDGNDQLRNFAGIRFDQKEPILCLNLEGIMQQYQGEE